MYYLLKQNSREGEREREEKRLPLKRIYIYQKTKNKTEDKDFHRKILCEVLLKGNNK